MTWWWAALTTAVGWSLVVLLWEALTRRVSNELTVVAGLAAAVLACGDQLFLSHAEGLAATLLPVVGLYAMGLVSAGTAKGFGALGAMVGLGATPGLWGVMLLSIGLKKLRKRPLPAGLIYLAGGLVAIVLHEMHVTRAAL